MTGGGARAPPDSLAVTTAPNPFNPSTTLHFQLPEAGPVTLTVYNVAGQVVAELGRGEVLEAGQHAREWHGTDERGRTLASGLYLYRLDRRRRSAGRQARLDPLRRRGPMDHLTPWLSPAAVVALLLFVWRRLDRRIDD